MHLELLHLKQAAMDSPFWWLWTLHMLAIHLNVIVYQFFSGRLQYLQCVHWRYCSLLLSHPPIVWNLVQQLLEYFDRLALKEVFLPADLSITCRCGFTLTYYTRITVIGEVLLVPWPCYIQNQILWWWLWEPQGWVVPSHYLCVSCCLSRGDSQWSGFFCLAVCQAMVRILSVCVPQSVRRYVACVCTMLLNAPGGLGLYF